MKNTNLANLFEFETQYPLQLLDNPTSEEIVVFPRNDSISVTVFGNLPTFQDRIENFELNGNLSERMTNYNFNTDHSNSWDKKHFLTSQRKCTVILRLPVELKKVGLVVLGTSPLWFCLGFQLKWHLKLQPLYICLWVCNGFRNGLRLKLQKEAAWKNSHPINETIFAITDKL